MSSVPAIVAPRGSWFASLSRIGSPCWATQPVKPSPSRHSQQRHVDVLVGAEAALEGDRDDRVRELDQVDPGVVVVDDPVGLLDDGPGDLLDRDGPAHPGGRGLEHLELGRPGSGLLEQLGVGQGDRGVRRQGRDEGHVAARPGDAARSVSADSAPMTRPLWISGAARWPAISRTPSYRAWPYWPIGADVRRRPGRDRCAGPRRPSPRHAGGPAGGPRPRRAGRPRR